MNISKRLKEIIKCAVKCEFLADIGTDHAYIPIFLVENKIAKRAAACDISEGSLIKAKKNILEHNYENFIETRTGNGLSAIKEGERPDQIIIAGMGGMLIIDILENAADILKNAKRIILQPQRDIDKVRRTVHKLGLKIIDERMIFESGKYYNIIVCENGVDFTYNEIEYFFGKILIEQKNTFLKKQVKHELLKINNILKKMENKMREGRKNENFIKRFEKISSKKMLYINMLEILA